MNIEKVEQIMAEKGITRADLARACGTQNGAVSHWLSGRNVPDVKNAAKICAALGVKFEDIFENEEK